MLHFSGWHLSRLLIEAIDELAMQRAILKELEDMILVAYITKWEEMVYTYERDSTKPDLFTEKENGMYHVSQLSLELTTCPQLRHWLIFDWNLLQKKQKKWRRVSYRCMR